MIHQVYHGIEPQQPIDKSPNQQNGRRKRRDDYSNEEFNQCQKIIQTEETDKSKSKITKPECVNNELNDAYLSTFGFLIDRTIQDQPITVFKSAPSKVIYNFTRNDGLSNVSTCVVMEPMERNTGAIGYLTSKNDLDIVTVITNGGMVRDPVTGEYVKIITDLKIFKKSLKNSLIKNERIDKKIFDNLIVKKSLSRLEKEKNISELEFKNSQSWTGYMGSKSDSSFE